MRGSSILKQLRLMIMVSFLIQIFLAGNALGLHCNGQIVNIGETPGEVAKKCNEAILKEHRTVKVEETDEDGAVSTITTTIDEWTYDSGPEELVHTYLFRNGKLTEIGSAGYGTVRDFSIDTCRNGELLRTGDSSVETYLKCGEPLAKEKRADKVIESEDHGKKLRTFLPVVEWTYRYGRDLPGYTVTFENGVATQIRTREFGK